MRNFEANTISVEDVLHTLREYNRDGKYEHAMDHFLTFASELTGLSEDVLLEQMYKRKEQEIDFSKLAFRDFDDTEAPAQFFFEYEVPQEQMRELVGYTGYRLDLCQEFTLVLDVFDRESCSLEAVLTFTDGDERWVDVATSVDDLDTFVEIVRKADSDRAREALKIMGEIIGELEREVPEQARRVNREKLAQYLVEEMIIEFDSPEECMEFFNACDGQNFKSVAEMKEYQGEYGFGLDGKWYHVDFDEALDVCEPLCLEEQIGSAEGDRNIRKTLENGLVDRVR